MGLHDDDSNWPVAFLRIRSACFAHSAACEMHAYYKMSS